MLEKPPRVYHLAARIRFCTVEPGEIIGGVQQYWMESRWFGHDRERILVRAGREAAELPGSIRAFTIPEVRDWLHRNARGHHFTEDGHIEFTDLNHALHYRMRWS
jgi:hypothetical protein